MSTTVQVELGDRSYPITIGRDLPVGCALAGTDARTAMIVSDTNVDPLHGENCAARLRDSGIDPVARAVVPAGESSKSSDQLSRLYARAVEANLDRTSCIVALGGGVVGDLAGYLASTYLRGIRLLQVPTSLLAMVDSSVGGKTGINLPQGKNLVGTFYQPAEVTADLSALATLPEREYVSGLAEVVKYGIIRDREFFDFLAADTDTLLQRDEELLEKVIARCCEIKAAVVAEDERESGLRAILNFGHTLAHALETASGYDTLLHGEAVSIGMVYGARLSVKQQGMPAAERNAIIDLLRKLGLPVEITPGTSWDRIRAVMISDKKTRDLTLRFVLARSIGSATINCEVGENTLAETFGEAACPE
jgi:3-dehydroquinate synthase